MPQSFYQQLNSIIILSEQILDKLNDEFKSIQGELSPEPNAEISGNILSNDHELAIKQLAQWSIERDKLTKLAFNSQNAEHFNQQLNLINKIVMLDQKLTQHAETNKQWLKSNRLNIQKNKKATKTYKTNI